MSSASGHGDVAIKQSSHEQDEDICHLSSLSFGPQPLTGIPAFISFSAHRQHILVHMAAVLRHWARSGFTEGISGHVSVRDPEYTNCIWMNPIGKHFGLMCARDMLCIRLADGKIVNSNAAGAVNRPGFYIHSAIHEARPDADAACHAHTIAGRAWAALGQPLEMITQDVCDLYESIALGGEYTGIVGAEEEGRQIAQTLGDRDRAAILRNHGLLTVGATVDEAAFLLGLVDRSCDIQLRVEAACAGNPNLRKLVIPAENARQNRAMAGEKNWLYAEAQPDVEYEIAMAHGAIQAGVEQVAVALL